MECKRTTKATGTRISYIATAMKANTHEIPIINFPWRTTQAGPVSVISVPLASSVICVSRNCRNEPRSDVDEASFVAVYLWHGNCTSKISSTCQRRMDMARKTLAELLVDVLAEAGVERVYGVPGDSLNRITDSIRVRQDISWPLPSLIRLGRLECLVNPLSVAKV